MDDVYQPTRRHTSTALALRETQRKMERGSQTGDIGATPSKAKSPSRNGTSRGKNGKRNKNDELSSNGTATTASSKTSKTSKTSRTSNTISTARARKRLTVSAPNGAPQRDGTATTMRRQAAEKWFSPTQQAIIKTIYFSEHVGDPTTGLITANGMRALMLKFRLQRIPEEWQVNNAFESEMQRATGMAPVEHDADDEGEMKTVHSWTYDLFLECMGLGKMAAENQGNDKTNHSVLRELFHSLDFSNDGADGVAHQQRGDGELSSDEIYEFMNLASGGGQAVGIEDCQAMLLMAKETAEDQELDEGAENLSVEGFVELMATLLDTERLLALAESYPKEAEHWNSFMTILDVLHFVKTFSETVSIEHAVKKVKGTGMETVEGKRCFWSPDQTGRTLWDVFMFPLLAYIIVVIPLRIGFDITEPVGTFLWWIDLMTDIYFAIDIFMNLRTAIIDEHGHLITDSKKIACNYLQGWFVIDFGSVLPLQYIMLLAAPASTDEDADDEAGSQVKLAKILRLVRLAKNVARLGRIKKLQELWTKYEDYLEPILTGLSLGKLFFLLLVLGHLMACVWYYFGVDDEVRADNHLVRSWVFREGWGENVGVWSRYVSAYTYTLSDFVPEIAYTETEKLTSLVLHLLYETFFGFLVGTMATIVMAGQASAQKKDEKIQAVREITSKAGVPLKKKKIIRSFYDTMYKHKTIFDEEEMIEELPESARKIMVDGIGESFKSNYQMFLGCDEEVVVKLFLAMRQMRFVGDRNIVVKGDVARELYFLIHGNAHVCLHTGSCSVAVGQTKDGDEKAALLRTESAVSDALHWIVPQYGMFGEVEMLEMIKKADGKENPMLKHLRRRRTVRTVSVSDVGFIFYKDMIPLMSDYPDLDYRLRRQSRLRLLNEERQRQKPGGEGELKGSGPEAAAPAVIFKDPPISARMKTLEENMAELKGMVKTQKAQMARRFDELVSTLNDIPAALI